MQITHFRTPASVRRHTLAVPREARMPGALVEYARFVEVQQRRARIIAELERPPETPAPQTGPTTVDQFIDVGESLTSIDASTTRGSVDVR
jgi:hypothetical protein